MSQEVIAALAGAFIGGIVGSFLGLVCSYFLQNRSFQHNFLQFSKERAYSPLFNDFEEVVEFLNKGFPLSVQVWNQMKPYRYCIDDDVLRQRIRKFYVETVPNYNEALTSCTNFFPNLVDRDLRDKLPNTGALERLISDVSSRIGWKLHRNGLTDTQLSLVNDEYEQLKTAADSKLTGSMQDYSLAWKQKYPPMDVSANTTKLSSPP